MDKHLRELYTITDDYKTILFKYNIDPTCLLSSHIKTAKYMLNIMFEDLEKTYTIPMVPIGSNIFLLKLYKHVLITKIRYILSYISDITNKIKDDTDIYIHIKNRDIINDILLLIYNIENNIKEPVCTLYDTSINKIISYIFNNNLTIDNIESNYKIPQKLKNDIKDQIFRNKFYDRLIRQCQSIKILNQLKTDTSTNLCEINKNKIIQMWKLNWRLRGLVI